MSSERKPFKAKEKSKCPKCGHTVFPTTEVMWCGYQRVQHLECKDKEMPND